MSKILTITENLKQFCEILKDLQKQYGELPTFENNSMNRNSTIDYSKRNMEGQIRTELFNRAIKLFGYNSFPQIFSDASYKKLENVTFDYLGAKIKPTEVYRGVRNINHHANLLFDETYHAGIGDACNGLFTAINIDVAKQYIGGHENQTNILTFKLPNIKVIDDLSLAIATSRIFEKNAPPTKDASILEMSEFVSTLSDGDADKLYYSFINDPSLLAMFLGYDAVYDHHFPAFALLNRGKICVSESEANRIAKASNRTFETMQPS